MPLSAGQRDGDTLLDGLFEEGCDDPIVGTSAAGLIAIGFTCEGTDAEAVITETVEQAIARSEHPEALEAFVVHGRARRNQGSAAHRRRVIAGQRMARSGRRHWRE